MNDKSKKLELSKKINLSDFDAWVPADYLNDYYKEVEQDERFTLKFLVDQFKKIKNKPVALEFGIGPTLHHLLPLAPYVSEIHVADYLPSNLLEVKKWKEQDKKSHNWNKFTELVLKYEGNPNPTQRQIEEREDLTRNKITKFIPCDASLERPLLKEKLNYQMVLSCYCADSATKSKEVWQKYMKNIASLVARGGFFVTTALRHCKYYKVGERFFPCANLNELDFQDFFKNLDFDLQTVSIMVEQVPEHKDIGYESILLASAFKKT